MFVNYSLRLEEELWQKMKFIALIQKRTLADVTREAISSYLKEKEDFIPKDLNLSID